jgi:hypothetical protein
MLGGWFVGLLEFGNYPDSQLIRKLVGLYQIFSGAA